MQELLSIIWRCPLLGGVIIIMFNLTPYQFMLKMVSYKFKIKSDSSRIDNLTLIITVYVVALDLEVKLSYSA